MVRALDVFRELARDTRADTTTHLGRTKITVLGYLAEVERKRVGSGSGDGRVRSKRCGVKVGRRPKLTACQRAEVRKRKAAGEPISEISHSFNAGNLAILRQMETE